MASGIIEQSPWFLGALGAVYDPNGSGVIVSAFEWLQVTLLGTVATVIAVIAIAAVGIMMLIGRIDWRRGAIVA